MSGQTTTSRDQWPSQTPEGTAHRRRMMAYGRWQPYVDAQPVREHVQSLLAAGMGPKRIAEISGVAHGAISKLLYGDYGRHTPPSRRVRPETAQRLLAVQPCVNTLAGGALVPALGTIRRVHALAAIGWSISSTARAIGVGPASLHKTVRSEYVQAQTARAIRDLYERQCMTPGPSIRSRNQAAAKGWHPPLWWDEIDDPRDRVGGPKPRDAS